MKTLLAISGLVVLLCCSPFAAGSSAVGKSNRTVWYPAARYQVVSHYEKSVTLEQPEAVPFDRSTYDLDVTYGQYVVATGEDGAVTLQLRLIEGRDKLKTGRWFGLEGLDWNGVLWSLGPDSTPHRLDSAYLPVFSAKVAPTGALVEFSGISTREPLDTVPVPLYNWLVGFSGYPDGELEVGASWGRRVTVIFDGVGPFEVTSSSKVVRFETVAGHHCAVVESEISLHADAMEAVSSSQEWWTQRGSGEAVISAVSHVDATDRVLIDSKGSFHTQVKETERHRTEDGEKDRRTFVHESSGSIEVSVGVMQTRAEPKER